MCCSHCPGWLPGLRPQAGRSRSRGAGSHARGPAHAQAGRSPGLRRHWQGWPRDCAAGVLNISRSGPLQVAHASPNLFTECCCLHLSRSDWTWEAMQVVPDSGLPGILSAPPSDSAELRLIPYMSRRSMQVVINAGKAQPLAVMRRSRLHRDALYLRQPQPIAVSGGGRRSLCQRCYKQISRV